MTKTVKKSGVNIRQWVRDRILFLAVAIFVIGAGAYIGAEHVFDSHGIWFHPVREFALLISLIGVISLGYEIFLRELTFNEYKEALEEIVNPDAVRLGIHGIYKNRSELAQATSFEDLFKNVKEEEADYLKNYLIEHVNKKDFIFSYEWSKGDICLWDNLSILHMASEIKNCKRIMHRITIK